MQQIWIVAVALAMASWQPPAQPAASVATLDSAAWLAGCWVRESGERRIDEQWMAPRGGAMLGMSRTVSKGRIVEWEFLQIRETEAGLAYIAKPSGQAETTFMVTSATADELRFENPQHDFPQRIRYRRLPDGSLHARIEGMRNGQLRGVDFPFTRAAC